MIEVDLLTEGRTPQDTKEAKGLWATAIFPHPRLYYMNLGYVCTHGPSPLAPIMACLRVRGQGSSASLWLPRLVP